ncbi:MAG TPA: lipopolysaccharide biosynthesis protein [Xanthobacteraceae bacterium]|nr:lipopolysaccharide biosynthesis protein [Xanthobacteraceae bacterium]
MALTDFKQAADAAEPGLFARLRQRAIGVMSGEHAFTQRQAGAAFTIRVASAAIVFLSQALLARWMGSDNFGAYVYVWTWLLLAGDLVHLGLPLTAQRFIPEYTQASSSDLLRGYLNGSRWLTFLVGCVVAATAALIIYAVQGAFDARFVVPFYLACAALPVYGLTFMSDGLARSYNWIAVALLPAYIVRPLILIGAVAGLRLVGFELDAASVMAALAAAAWLSALVQVLQLNGKLKAVISNGPRRYEPRRWLGTALPIVFVWGFYALLTSTDVLVLEQFRPEHEVAYYYAAAKTLALVSIIYFAVAATTAHHFTAYHVAGDREGLARFAAATVRWVFWLSFGATVIILVLGRPALMLFGPDFAAGYPVMAILAVGQLARASVGPAERVLNVLGQQRLCAFAYAFAFAFNIGACLALAPAYGAVGAAIGTAGAFVVESALLFLIAKRGLGLHMFAFGPWRPAAAGPAPNQG